MRVRRDSFPCKGNYSCCCCLPGSFVHRKVFEFDLKDKLWIAILYLKKEEYLEGNYFPKVPHTVLVIGSPEKVAFVVSPDKDTQNNHLQN